MADDVRSKAEDSSLGRAMALIDRILCKVEFATLIVACAALFAIMLLVFFDAVLRYTVNSPLKFTSDIVTLYLISCALLLALSYTLRRGGHINVDLFVHVLPPRLYDILVGISYVCAVAVVGIMAREVTLLAWDSWVQNEVMVGIYAWPLWLSKSIVALSLLILDVRLMHVGVSHLIAGGTGNSTIAIPIAHALDEPVEEAV